LSRHNLQVKLANFNLFEAIAQDISDGPEAVKLKEKKTKLQNYTEKYSNVLFLQWIIQKLRNFTLVYILCTHNLGPWTNP
jgi:hypothetical protein